jgi:CheY-like chemotaxis protein
MVADPSLPRARPRFPHDHAVLLVEDDEESREALAAVLEACSFVVCEATDGQQALEQLAAGYRPCAILLDLMMPRMDGWEFRARQRADAELSSIPVALLTAAANVRAHASRLGVDASFPKPVDLNGVIAFVEGHCATD